MFGSQFAGGAHGVRPVELDMGPVAPPDFLLEKTDDLPRFTLAKQARPFGLAKPVQDLDALPGCPEHLCVGLSLKQNQCRLMLDVLAALVAQPPRGIGIQFHFLSEARKAVPSKVGASG